MQNLRRKYLQVLKIWNVDAIYIYRQAEKYLQVQRKASCRYNGLKKEHLQQRISEMCRYIFILKKIPNGLFQKTVHLVLWKMQVQCYIKNIL